MHKSLLVVVLAVSLSSCRNGQEQAHEQEAPAVPAVVERAPPAGAAQAAPAPAGEELAVVDNGQTWFRVKIAKNGVEWMDYEGSWPLFLLAGNSATLQLSKSQQIMSVTDILTIYMNGVPAGTVPIVLSNSDKGTASMIMSPVTDGAYGLPISPTEGTLAITKHVDRQVSGTFESKAVDLNGDVYVFKGYFLNATINPDKS